jgi:hypothetical protein
MPGWAAKAPLRQLLAERHRGQGQPTPAAIDEALAFARRMRDAGAAYFQVSPLIGMHLESIAGMSRNYLAHEYFNRDWSPSYHAEVASDLAAAKLTFAAPSALAEQIDHLSLGDKAQELLQEVADPAARETLRDYFVNRQFRRDIFVRGGRQLSAREREERLLATRVALVTPVLPAKVRFPLGEVTLDPQTYGPIADSLAERPRPLAELLAQPRVAAVGPNAAFQAAVVLIASGHVAPALDAEGEEGRQASVARFNKAVLARVANGGGESTLASPVLGTGLPVPPVDRLFLAAEAANLPQPVEWLLKTMTARSQQILKEGRPVASGDEARAELQLSHTEFRKYRMPFYQGMGVLIRPPSS